MTARRAVLVAVCITCAVGPAFAQEGGGAATSQPTLRERISAKRAELSEVLAVAKRNLAAAAAQQGADPPPHLTQEVELLETTELLYGQQEAQLQRSEELRTSRVRLEADLAAQRASGPPEERPDSFLLLESVRSELNAHSGRGANLDAAREAALKTLENARGQLADRERGRRQAKERFDTASDEAQVAALAVTLRMAELESRLATERVALHEFETANQEVGDAIYELRLTLLKEKAAWIESRARFTQNDLDKQLDQVARAGFSLKRRLEEAKLDLESAARRLADVRRRRDRAAETDQALVEEVEAARLEREARQIELLLLQDRLQRLVLVKQLWTRRFRTFNGEAEREELATWETEAQDARAQLDSDYRLQTDEAADSRNTLLTLREKLTSAREATPGVRRWLRDQVRSVQTRINSHEFSIAGIETSRRLCGKLLAEIGDQTASISFGQRLAGLWESVKAVWNYELMAVQDRPITVSKIVVVIVLLIVGVTAARYFCRFLGRRLLPRVGLNEGAAAALQSIVFYVLVLGLALVSLKIVNVPLTAFTIAGGALAIGVGFGSQNLVNNFLSGLILLIERPIRVGDLIEVGDLLGSVEHIGPRSTRVRSADNVDIIVPNSSFLEHNVVNWTLSDDRYRAHVTVGLAYGTSTREAAKLIRRAVEEHGKVLKTPKAIVLFTGFGDNALDFEVHFWVRMRRLMDRKVIESDIRYRIDSLFREAGVVIAFPQRDLHIDTLSPVEVRVLSDQASPAAASADE